MRTRIGLSLFGLATVAVGLPSCDNLDAGRLADDPEAPVITRILVQDANTYVVTDLLNDSLPLKCSDINPCPVGTSGLSPTTCHIPDGMTEGECDNPTSNTNIIPIGDGATLQVRVILSKSLDPGPTSGASAVGPGGVEEVTLQDGSKVYKFADPTAVQLIGPDGKEVGATACRMDDECASGHCDNGQCRIAKYYTPSGSNWDTADPIFEPLGPALVIDILEPLEFSATYTIKVNGASLKDKTAKVLTETSVNGKKSPINSAGYTFKTEALAALGATPDITSSPTIAPNDVIQVEYAGPVDAKMIKAEVKGMAGTVATEVWNDLDDMCTADPVLVNIFVSGGSAQRWPAGKLTISITGKDAGGHDIVPLEGDFTVSGPDGMGDNAIGNHPPPSECGQPMPDMG